METNPRLVASCLGTGGGLLVREPTGWRRLDDLASTGFAVSDDGTRTARALWTTDDPQARSELLITDAAGVLRYLRVDDLREPHGLLWDGDLVVAVSTLDNRVVWIDEAGHVVDAVDLGGEGDAWHVNCPTWADGRLVVTAFGRHRQHRDWARSGAMDEAGVLLDLRTRDVLTTGFSAPHDPIRLDDGWLVCDSRKSRVLRLDDGFRPVAEGKLSGWTRGAVVDGDFVHVGVSSRRDYGGSATSAVATLALADLTVLESATLPCDEIFALALVPETLVAGLEIGFSVNPGRTSPLSPAGTELASGRTWEDQQPDVHVRARLEGDGRVPPDRFFPVRVELESHDAEPVFPTGDNAWRVGARWAKPDGSFQDDGPRCGLSHPLVGGDRQELSLRVRAPEEPGRHVLQVALVQEGRQWHPDSETGVAVYVDPAAGDAGDGPIGDDADL